MSKIIRYLALGDSYTIGELVPIYDSFPYQLVQLLRNHNPGGHSFLAPEILAKTGWTTDELLEGMANTTLLTEYDLVTLLIGVNNQYRGRTTENYLEEFTTIINKAISLAGNQPQKVIVFSIPDWGVTPFAAERDTMKIAEEIDAFNQICKDITLSSGCHHIDITGSQRIDGNKEEYLATDKLHPSGKEYAKWAKELFFLFNRST